MNADDFNRMAEDIQRGLCDKWTFDFIVSLRDVMNRKGYLSERQILLFKQRYRILVETSIDIDINNKISIVRRQSDWLRAFCDSIEIQLKSGIALSIKQENVLNQAFLNFERGDNGSTSMDEYDWDDCN